LAIPLPAVLIVWTGWGLFFFPSFFLFSHISLSHLPSLSPSRLLLQCGRLL
jgi:hypothetical protein